LTSRRFDTLSLVFSICFLPGMSLAQSQQAPAAPTPPAPPAAAQQTPKTSAPDYSDPRTLTFGVFYWLTGEGAGITPDLHGGSQAFDYETLYDLGKPKRGTPGIEISMPITRTGSLHFEIVQSKGDGNQTAQVPLDLFGQGFNQGDYLASQYGILASKLYLDDLLFPHKFPVAKFRLKSLWEFQYIHMKSTIDAPAYDLSGAPETAIGTRQIFLPTFGIAAEYALTPHTLARIDASGFGIPNKADIWDASATISYRHGAWEIYGGGKALHFKSSPNNVEYVVDTLSGAFVGVRWHWSL